jgi:hypothetical protein
MIRREIRGKAKIKMKMENHRRQSPSRWQSSQHLAVNVFILFAILSALASSSSFSLFFSPVKLRPRDLLSSIYFVYRKVAQRQTACVAGKGRRTERR